jgi:hypothetical protein
VFDGRDQQPQARRSTHVLSGHTLIEPYEMEQAMSQLTAPNQTIETASGITFAYRRFGNAATTALPVVCFQHYRGNLDNWDPALVDALARDREIILFDNAGVGGSSGTVLTTCTAMAVTRALS